MYIIGKFVFDEYNAVVKKNRESKSRIIFTWQEVFQYKLDYYFSSSKWAKPLTLLGLSFGLIFLGGVLLSVSTGDPLSSSAWVSWTYVADPGTHADAEGFMERAAAFFITLGGMLIFALMIGIISEEIGEKVDELKQGRSRVIESDHSLILGWSDKALPIMQQICLANESEGGGMIVVLADFDKEEMEETLNAALQSKEHAFELLGTEVIFRSGNCLAESDLKKVSISTARSIIALSSVTTDPDEADSKMLRQVLSLKAYGELSGYVVVEIQDVDNKCLIDIVAGGMAEVVVAHDVIGRLMIHCARSPGLGMVLEALVGFEESEFYIQEWSELTGKTFHEITCRFDDAIPVGIKSEDGEIKLVPNGDYVIKEKDAILVLAEDNDTYEVNDGRYGTTCGNAHITSNPKQKKETLLLCGWRRDMADLIMQLDALVSAGSELWLLNTVPLKERNELLKDKGNKDELELHNLSIKNIVGNPIIRRQLKTLVALDPKGNPTGEVAMLDEFDSILILADAGVETTGMEELDSRSLASLLIIQDLQRELFDQKSGESLKEYPSPISEILDTRTRSLLQVSNVQGFVMSNQIVSAMMAQIAEDRDMNCVLGELLSPHGCETVLRDISYFLDLEKENEASFWDIALRAQQRGELAIGYKPNHDSLLLGKVQINPEGKMKKRVWHEGDEIVVFTHHAFSEYRSSSVDLESVTNELAELVDLDAETIETIPADTKPDETKSDGIQAE